MYRKVLGFIEEIATIMYVGGILSHIVIGAVLGHPDAITAYNASVYKEMSAYILILPGLALKVLSDLIVFFYYKERANWLKVKMAMNALLSINAFIFLVPMMPELVALAEVSLPNGVVSAKFLQTAQLEMFIGQLNILPLLTELIVGYFKPKIGYL